MKIQAVLAAAVLTFAGQSLAADKVFFAAPADEAEVTSPFQVQFGLEGMQIGKIGDLTAGMGHHHLIIDAKGIDKGQVVPADDSHIHFGKGQTETELNLLPGEYTLTLQFADGAHRSYGADMSSTITVRVTGSAAQSSASDGAYQY